MQGDGEEERKRGADEVSACRERAGAQQGGGRAGRGPASGQDEAGADAGADAGAKSRKRRKHKMGQGRRIERFLGYCRFCDMELERNSTNPRKCDGGGLGSILGNAVVMAGVLAMLAFAVVRKLSSSATDSPEVQRAKLMLRDAGLVLLVVGVASERGVRHLQSSCCCRCAVARAPSACSTPLNLVMSSQD
jgi:uncharacterized protein YjeT (DUF2065 family)